MRLPILGASLALLLATLVAPLDSAGQEGQAARAGGWTAITGVTAHPVSSPPIEDATLLIEGDTLRAVGSAVEVPAAARVVELPGRHVFPAFILADSVLGLVEINSVPGTVDVRETGELNPALRTETAFHADSRLLPPTLAGGVLFAHVVPQGGLLAGTSALMRLDGWNWRQMTVAAPVAMHLHFPRYAPRDDAWWLPSQTQEQIDEERAAALALLERAFADARAYRRARAAMRAGGRFVAADPQLEALLPLLDGDIPLFVHADEHRQIEGALDWTREQGIERLVLVSHQDAAGFAERLARDAVPVIYNGVLRLPQRDDQPYDEPFTAPARLLAAGVELAIGTTGSGYDAANSRNLPFHAAMAAAYGMPREAALAAITLRPAEILGVDDRLGSLEPGKEASFVVTDGDPLEIGTAIEALWSAGAPVDLERDPQRRLWQRYRQRPLPAAAGEAP